MTSVLADYHQNISGILVAKSSLQQDWGAYEQSVPNFILAAWTMLRGEK